MDRERRHAEARMPNRKARLIETSELPSWLTKDPKELEKAILDQEAIDVFGRGTRQRKEVDYSDSLTEKEWLRVIFRTFFCFDFRKIKRFFFSSIFLGDRRRNFRNARSGQKTTTKTTRSKFSIDRRR